MNKGRTIRPPLARIHLALVVAWAAVMAASHAIIIPALPLLGIGRPFSFASVMTPLAGIFFGPLAGALCAAVSGYVGSLLSPGGAWLGPFSFVIGTITAFTAGCVAWGGRLPLRVSLRGNFVVNGAIIVYLVGTVLWFGHGTGRGLPLLPLVYYGLGFAAVLAGSVFAGRMLAGEKRALKVPALMLCAFAGLVGGASVANFFTLVLYDLPTPVWKVLTFQAPLERLFFSLGTALVGAPLLASLPKLGIFLGPRFEEDPPEGTFPEDDESDDENEKPKTDDTEATDED